MPRDRNALELNLNRGLKKAGVNTLKLGYAHKRKCNWCSPLWAFQDIKWNCVILLDFIFSCRICRFLLMRNFYIRFVFHRISEGKFQNVSCIFYHCTVQIGLNFMANTEYTFLFTTKYVQFLLMLLFLFFFKNFTPKRLHIVYTFKCIGIFYYQHLL